MITISNGWTGSFPDTFFGVLVIEGINNTRGDLTLSVLAKNSPIHDQKADKMGILIF